MALRFTLSSSDVGLQRLLYASLFSSAWFGAALVGVTAWKLAYLDVSDAMLTGVGTPVLVSAWALTEVFRLRLGYAGNLGERVRGGARARRAARRGVARSARAHGAAPTAGRTRGLCRRSHPARPPTPPRRCPRRLPFGCSRCCPRCR